jgi:methionyl-tRNA formyltransferase
MAARAVVFGYGDIGVRCLAVLLEAGLEVPLVVTHQDDPAEARWYASVHEYSKNCGLAVIADPAAGVLASSVAAIQPDLIFSFYYRSMLPMSVLRLAGRGAFNMHGSLLPRFRGRAPLNWAILKGETETGVTLHEMVAKPDAGRIVDQQAVPIGADETAVEVFAKMVVAAEAVLKRSIGNLAHGTISFKPNDLSKGSYYGRRTPEDGRIDWSRSAKEVHDLVRAVAPPFPGAFTDGMRVLKTALTGKTHAGKSLGPFTEGGQWFGACGDGKVLRLLEIQEQ